MTSRCPICNKEVSLNAGDKLPKDYPFCSDRCKMIDLGGWFDEGYRVADDFDEDEAIEEES